MYVAISLAGFDRLAKGFAEHVTATPVRQTDRHSRCTPRQLQLEAIWRRWSRSSTLIQIKNTNVFLASRSKFHSCGSDVVREKEEELVYTYSSGK